LKTYPGGWTKRSGSVKAEMMKHFDPASLIVIIITFVLFAAALFTKGFTHDLLLEAGVLLVSIKIIMLAYKNSTNVEAFHRRLNEIYEVVKRLDSRNSKY
jgi:uncharacterized BrkB/YihY/UPF0761 family membrane protein